MIRLYGSLPEQRAIDPVLSMGPWSPNGLSRTLRGYTQIFRASFRAPLPDEDTTLAANRIKAKQRIWADIDTALWYGHACEENSAGCITRRSAGMLEIAALYPGARLKDFHVSVLRPMACIEVTEPQHNRGPYYELICELGLRWMPPKDAP
jgi:hypothetical protein